MKGAFDGSNLSAAWTEIDRAPIPSGDDPSEQIVEAVRAALETLDDTVGRVVERFGTDVLVANHPYFAA